MRTKKKRNEEVKRNQTKRKMQIIYIYTKEIEFIATQLNFYVCVDDD